MKWKDAPSGNVFVECSKECDIEIVIKSWVNSARCCKAELKIYVESFWELFFDQNVFGKFACWRHLSGKYRKTSAAVQIFSWNGCWKTFREIIKFQRSLFTVKLNKSQESEPVLSISNSQHTIMNSKLKGSIIFTSVRQNFFQKKTCFWWTFSRKNF